MSDIRSLHVVHIISGLGQGGAETVLHRLVTAPGQVDRHTVVSMTDAGVFGPRLQAAGIDVVALGMPSGRLSPGGLWRLYRLLRQTKPDVVQTWMYHADLVGGVIARLAGVRAVYWGIRNSGANLEQSSPMARAIAWLCARLSGVVPTGVIACADEAARRHQAWGYRADRMQVVPNGYDLSRWHPDPEARALLRAEWGVDEGTPLLGSVARWNPLKDHANLLEAFGRLAASWPQARCVLVGQGMSDDNTALMTLANRFGVRDKLILLGMREDVPAIMSALDVHVLSSCAEGFPNVVAEAMASGVACVVTDVGDAARIVGEAGWVVPARDPEALSGAMDKALAQRGSAGMADKLREGRDRVGRLYGLATMVQAYHAAWRGQGDPARGAPCLVFVVNNPAFFMSHRLPVARAAVQAGYAVHVATMDGPAVEAIRGQGLTHHVIPMSRSGKNPIEELQTFVALWRLFRRLRPRLVHAVTIKPVLYGGIAARLAGVPAYVAAVSGLGFIFIRERKGLDLLRRAATALYRLALGHRNSRVIFQNAGDRDVLEREGVVRPEQVVLIRGSGVDLARFAAEPEPPGAPVAVMASRLLADKGVYEYVDAARIAAGDPSGLRWVLAGSPDPGNPASITEQEVGQWAREGVIDYVGEQSDVAALYRRAHIAVLPSYREGLPKSLIEAAACARAVVTTDVPGCRDAIEPDVTGLLVPVRDARALAQAVQRLAGDDALRRRMGAAGRVLAEREFDVRKVVEAHLAIYRSLLDRP